MSAIAEFRLMRPEDLPGLLAIQLSPPPPPPKRSLLSWFQPPAPPPANPHWDYLQTHSRTLEDYHWSGWVLAGEVFTLLDEHGLNWRDFTASDLAAMLDARPDVFYFGVDVYRRSDAQRLIERLNALALTDADIQESLDANERYGIPAPPLQSVRDGLDILVTWLAQVDDAHIGLLKIG